MLSMLRDRCTVSEWVAFVVHGLASATEAVEMVDDDEFAVAL